MEHEERNPDGSPIMFIDSATMWAAAQLEILGPDAPELTDEEFQELVERISEADRRVEARGDKEEGVTEED